MYWYLHSLIIGSAVLYLVYTRKKEKIFYSMAVILFVIGIMFAAGILSDNIIGSLINIVFGSERNIFNVGLFYMGIGYYFAKSNVRVSLKYASLLLIITIIVESVAVQMIKIRFMQAFVAIALFFIACQIDFQGAEDKTTKIRQLSTAIYLEHFPVIILFDYFLKKGTLIDFTFTLSFSILIYWMIKRIFPRKWVRIIYGN